jgi:DNA-binding transcriptional MerR regulator
MSRQDGT